MLSFISFSSLYSESNTSTLEKIIFQKVNDYRISQGQTPLQYNAIVTKMARQQSQNMACGRAPFSHAGADDRFDKIRVDVVAHHFGENLFFCEKYPESHVPSKALELWIKSSGHRKNMLGNYDRCGVGVATDGRGTYYCTQLFIK